MTMAENIDVNVNVNTSAAVRNLQNLDKQVTSIGDSFATLRNLVGGIAFTNIIRGALQLADSIDDVSKATGLATSTVIGFGQALAQNGGTIADAQNALTRLSQTISEAQNGNQNAITSFNELGISISDIATLSDEQILQKVIAGLGQIKDKGDQARIATDLLGKSVKGIDFTGVSQDIGTAIQNSAKYASSNKSAADAAQNLQNIQAKLTQDLILAIQPISELVKKIDANSESFNRWKNAILTFLGVLGGLFVLGRLITLLTAFARAASVAAETLGKLKFRDIIKPGTGEIIFKEIKVLEQKMRDIAKARKGMYPPDAAQKAEHEMGQLKRLQVILEETRGFFANLAAGALAAASAVGAYFGLDTSDAEKKSQRPGRPGGGRGVPNTDQQIADFQKLQKAYNDGKAKVDSYTASLQKEIDAVAGNINLQAKYLTLTQNEVELLQAQKEVIDKVADARIRYQEMLQGLDPKNENDRKLIEYINGQVAALQSKEKAGLAAAKAAVEGLQKEKAALDEVVKQTELQKLLLTDAASLKALQDQMALIGLYGEELENANIALEVSASLEQRLLELRQLELDLIVRKGQLTKEQYNRELAQIEALRQAAYEKAGAEIDLKTQTQQAQKAADEDATLGIKKYIKELEDSVSPAKVALQSVQTVFSGISNALDTFVQTGKFKFKDFALSIIRDLLLIQAKAAATQIFTSILKGLKIPFLAEGGPATANKPYIVGEKGPELFVPKQSGTVVPNDQMGRGNGMVNAPVTNNYITNNINALDAKSVAQLFAENRKTLLGVTETARREMAYGR